MTTNVFTLRDIANETPRFYQKDIHTVMNGQLHIAKFGEELNTEEDIEAYLSILPTESRQVIIAADVDVVVYRDPSTPVMASVRRSRGDLLLIINLYMCDLHHEMADTAEQWEVIMGEILAHELKHVEQMREGRLDINFAKNKIIWEGQECDYVSDPTSLAYLDQPWEMEAHLAGLECLVERGVMDNDDAWEALLANFKRAA
jgi:hypothetical protein